jgi:hypothetical protein
MKDDESSSLLDLSEEKSTYYTTRNQIDKCLKVKTSTLDAAFRDYKERLGFKRPFLKMDTQGDDLAVAEGRRNSLRMFVGLQTEVAFKRLCKNFAEFTWVVDFFKDYGFDLSNLQP